jgi:CDP-diacylglycerol--glycerol-3-phosphate 3-phosphatidyltransferase
MFHYPALGIHFHAVGMFFLWGALVFTVWSGADYFLRFRKLLGMNFSVDIKTINL